MNGQKSEGLLPVRAGQRSIWTIALVVLLPVLWIVFTPAALDPDTYQYYAIASAYHVNLGNVATIGANTVGPIVPLTVLAARTVAHPGSDLQAVTYFLSVLAAIFVALAWAESLYLVSRRTRDWRMLVPFSALFLLLIDWSHAPFRSLNGELFSAPFLIGLLIFAPGAGWNGKRQLAGLLPCILLLAMVFFTKLQAYPIACFAFAFAGALRGSFRLRDGGLRLAIVAACSGLLAALPVILGLHSQDVVAHAVAYLQGAPTVAPAQNLAALALYFWERAGIGLFGVVVTIFAAGLAIYFLKPPPSQELKRGLTQAEWFTLGMIVTAILCICISMRFFTHYALLLLPALPLAFDVLAARMTGMSHLRLKQTVFVGLLGLAALYQIGLGSIVLARYGKPGTERNAGVQHNAERIRALCHVDAFPVVVHGGDYRYYIALGSYPSFEGADVIRQSGYNKHLIDAYTRHLRETPHVIVDLMAQFRSPVPATFDLAVGHLIGPTSSRYRSASIAPGVEVYCPNTRL